MLFFVFDRKFFFRSFLQDWAMNAKFWEQIFRASTPIDIWKLNYPPIWNYDRQTERQTDRPNNGQTDTPKAWQWLSSPNQLINLINDYCMYVCETTGWVFMNKNAHRGKSFITGLWKPFCRCAKESCKMHLHTHTYINTWEHIHHQ